MKKEKPDSAFQVGRTIRIPNAYLGTLFLCFLAVALLVSWPGLETPMVYDSRGFISDKVEIFSQKGLSGVIGLLPARPLAMASFYLNYVLTGMNPFFFRLVNICLLAGCAIIVCILLYELLAATNSESGDTPGVSLAIATLLALMYLVHPLQTFLSLYIYQRMALMSSFCFLSALALYLGIRSEMVKSYYFGYCMVFILYQIGMFSKPNIFTFPLILLLAEMAFFHTGFRQLFKLTVIFFVCAAPYFVVMKLLVGATEGIAAPDTGFIETLAAYYQDSGFSLKEIALTNCRVLFLYVYAILVPIPSNVHLVQALAISRSLLEPASTMLACMALLALSAFGVAITRRRPLTGFGITFFLVTIIPENFLVPQYLYVGYRPVLPMTGLLFVAADLIRMVSLKLKHYVGTRMPAKAVFLMLIPLICFLATVTWIESSLWSNQLLFWKQSYETFPSYGPNTEKKVYLDTLLNIGDAYCELGQWAHAANHYRKAMEIEPRFATLHNNLGLALLEMGQTGPALEHLNQALELNPRMPDAYNNAGLLLLKIGDTNRAIDYFYKAITLDPGLMAAYGNLGTALISSGQLPEAVDILSKALRIHPFSAQAHNNLGFAYYKLGNMPEAIEHFKKTLEIEPQFLEAQENLRRALKGQP
jgi:protein O-mannosyl-transferase